MGVDIHMSIINANGQYIREDIFDGRDYAWFDNITDRGDELYRDFPNACGIPSNVPNQIMSDYNNSREWGYYDFRYVSVKEFCKWFDEKQPQVSAGWITTYDKWMYEKKGIYPPEIIFRLSKDNAATHDYHFVEIVDEYEGSYWLYNFIKDNNIPEDAIIVYYFDC